MARWRDRLTAAVKGEPQPSGEHLDEALQTGVATLLTAHADAAALGIARAWRALDGGGTLLSAHPELAHPGPTLTTDVERLVREWQGEVLELVRGEGSRRTNARIAAYGINGIGLFLMLVTFAHTGGLTGAEAGIAGGTSLLAQKVLEAIFGDQAVREMATRARSPPPRPRRRPVCRAAHPVRRGRRRAGPSRRTGRSVGRGRRGGQRGEPMSPLRRGRATVPVPTAEELARAGAELEAAVASGGAALPADGAATARAVADKLHARTSLHGGHTVVALAGATGSGKSSIFNALVGAEVATVGMRRPTTADVTSAYWGDEPVGPLLDWLGVLVRHRVDAPGPGTGAGEDPAEGPEPAAVAGREGDGEVAGDLSGLVLLDLPDLDSRELSHRAEAERILERVDVFVWVTDPQKYADARLHDDHIAALADPRCRDDGRAQPDRPPRRRGGPRLHRRPRAAHGP